MPRRRFKLSDEIIYYNAGLKRRRKRFTLVLAYICLRYLMPMALAFPRYLVSSVVLRHGVCHCVPFLHASAVFALRFSIVFVSIWYSTGFELSSEHCKAVDWTQAWVLLPDALEDGRQWIKS